MDSASLVLSPAVTRVVRHEAFRAWRSLRRFGLEVADVRQELLIHLFVRSAHYDRRRSSPSTFASRVCHKRTLQIIESANSAKRGGGVALCSLSDPVRLKDRKVVEFGATLNGDHSAVLNGRQTRPAAALLRLHLDVERILAGLPHDLAVVARRLAEGNTPSEVARDLSISRATLHRRVVQLRQVFLDAGMGDVTVREVA